MEHQNNMSKQSEGSDCGRGASRNSFNSDGVRQYGKQLGLKWKKKPSSISFGSRNKDDKFGWVKRLIAKEKPAFVAFQETKLNTIDISWIYKLWGSDGCDFIQKPKVGKSGGQILTWDTNLFEAESVDCLEFGIGIRGIWKNLGCKFNVLNVYGPHDDSNKHKFWESMSNIISGGDEAWVICGDFNEVRYQSERFNCDYIEYMANWFNDFIESNRLIDIPMVGRNFTRTSIGPFKVFDIWFENDEVEDIIRNAWLKEVAGGFRKDCIFRNKLKNVKSALKDWSKNKFEHLDGEIEQQKSLANFFEVAAESRSLTEDERDKWREARKSWFEKERIKTSMLRQKARIKWIVDGDENTKLFHSSIKRRLNNNTIRGLRINGVCNDSPEEIKTEAFNHFKCRFEEIPIEWPSLDELIYPTLSVTKANELEGPIEEKRFMKQF